jgi:hypothetical protein
MAQDVAACILPVWVEGDKVLSTKMTNLCYSRANPRPRHIAIPPHILKVDHETVALALDRVLRGVAFV